LYIVLPLIVLKKTLRVRLNKKKIRRSKSILDRPFFLKFQIFIPLF
jgi:hypothetical protein